MISMKPWKYDHNVHPIPWKQDEEEDARDKKRLKVGVMRDDGRT